MKRQRYLRPPIVEALCEIRFRGSQWDEAVPGQFYDAVRETFPNKQQVPVLQTAVRFEAAGEISTSIRPTLPRMRFTSASGETLVQVATDLLVVNRLPPYPSFEAWSPIVEQMIGHYRRIALPEAATQIAVRYINKIGFAEPAICLEEYFTVYPEVPEELDRKHGTFMLRAELVAREPGVQVMLTFGSAPPDPPDQGAQLLDIYARASVSQKPEDDLMALVRRAQGEAERVFEACITDRLRDRFVPEART